MRGKFGTNTTVKLLGGSLRINMPGRETRRAFNSATRLIEASEDLKPVLNAFGDYMLGRIDKQFQYEGLPRRWPELAPSTVQEKRRLGYGDRGILVRTGRLRRGFRKKVTPRTLQIINRRSVRGVNLYRVHQEGTNTIPARRMLVYTRVERDRLSQLIEEHMNG